MLKIRKDESEGKWFSYGDGVDFRIRPLTTNRLKELRARATTSRMELDGRTRKMVQVEDVNETALEDAITDFIIEDFRGVGDADGNPLPVTLESKRLIVDQVLLREFIWAAAQSLDMEADLEKKS